MTGKSCVEPHNDRHRSGLCAAHHFIMLPGLADARDPFHCIVLASEPVDGPDSLGLRTWPVCGRHEGRELDAHDECVLRRSSWNARKYRSRTARGSPRCAWVCCEDFAHAIANDFSTLYWHAITYPTQRSADSVDVLSKPSTFLHFGLTCCIQHTELLANSRKRCVTGTTFNPALLVPRRAPPCGLNIARLTVMCSVRVLRAACA